MFFRLQLLFIPRAFLSSFSESLRLSPDSEVLQDKTIFFLLFIKSNLMVWGRNNYPSALTLAEYNDSFVTKNYFSSSS